MLEELLNYAPLLVFILLGSGVLNRRQEVDGLGNPALRLRGPFLVLLFLGVCSSWIAFVSRDASSGKFSLFCFAALICFVGSFLAFKKRIILHQDRIEDSCTQVFRTPYYLTTLESLRPEGKKGEYLAIHFAHGRKVSISGYYSGLPHFIEKLREELQRSGHRYEDF